VAIGTDIACPKSELSRTIQFYGYEKLAEIILAQYVNLKVVIVL
jgi:hypothetical protein